MIQDGIKLLKAGIKTGINNTTMKELIEKLTEAQESIDFAETCSWFVSLEKLEVDFLLESLQSKGKTKSVEGSDVLSFLGNSKRQFAKECGCERCLEILSIHKREEYAQSHANKDGVSVNGWYKLTDVLPEAGQKVDLWLVPEDEEKSHRITWTWEKENTASIRISGCKVTHWMPLPPKPQR